MYKMYNFCSSYLGESYFLSVQEIDENKMEVPKMVAMSF